MKEPKPLYRADSLDDLGLTRELIRRVRDGIVLSRPGVGFVDANPAFLELCEAGSVEELRRHQPSELWADPDERLALVEDLERQDVVTGRQMELRTLEGNVRHAEGDAYALRDEEGEVGAWLVVVRDVSERRAAEEQIRQSERFFRALTENAFQTLTVLDADATARFTAGSVRRVLGYEVEEVVGRNLWEIVHPDDRPELREMWNELVAEPGGERSTVYRVRHKDGSWRHLESTATNLLDDPAIDGIVINSRDITARRELEAQLLQSQKMEAIGRLAGGIAHDFNNLLTAIGGYADLALEELPADHPVRGEIAEILRGTERAASLTQQLLAFGRRQLLQARVVDLNAAIRELEDMLRRLLGEDIEVRTRLAEGLGRIEIDPAQLEQVIVSLAVNARDAMPRGGTLSIETADVELDEDYVATHPQAEAGEHVLLAVSDTGVGIEPELKERIFEPFFTTKETGQGTGLGLATVYGVVRQSGGHIWVYSEPGEGATFKIYFPRTREAGEESPKAAARELRLPLGDEKVLLVEDDPAVRRLASRVLESCGYALVAAADPGEAIELLESGDFEPDLLVTDVVMPGEPGPEFAARVRQIFPRLPVVFISGYMEGPQLQQALELPGSTFLGKPFSPATFARKVREVLDAA